MFGKFLEKLITKIGRNKSVKRLFLSASGENLLAQNNAYFQNGFNRELAISTLNKTLNKIYGKNYSEDLGMWSEHLILFAAIKNQAPDLSRILEIGTFDGQTSRILSDLFPNSEITTIDLPLQSVKHKNIYKYAQRDNYMENFRSENLSKCSNVTFVEKTSLALINHTGSYDLIWIDGAHGYPIVAIDIANSIRMCNPNGFILCDDVYKFTRSNDSEYMSTATYETLLEFQHSGFIEFQLILKRINKIYSFNKKYVGIIKKVFN
jgi:predicted O-methyltransferase YrrM